MMSFERILEVFNTYLKENKFIKSPTELYKPINYWLEGGGKRIRPILLSMSYNLYNENIKNSLPCAFAIELFHNFTLIHDDIMDKAPTRRGKETIHIKYDLDRAILVGDIMMSYAFDYVTKVPENVQPKIMKELIEVSIDVNDGQQIDKNFEDRIDVTLDEYIKMISLKTCSLLSKSGRIGAILAEAPLDDVRLLGEFGYNVGVSFQIQDDILDVYGKPGFGKRHAGDIIENKKTFLFLKALELHSNKKELIELYSNSKIDDNEKIMAVKDIFNQVDAKSAAQEEKEKYQKHALRCLNLVGVKEERKVHLIKLANNLFNREV